MRAARFCIRTSKKGKVKDGIDSQSVKASRVRPVIVTLTDRSKDGRFRANVPHADMQHGTLLSNTIKHVPSTRPRRKQRYVNLAPSDATRSTLPNKPKRNEMTRCNRHETQLLNRLFRRRNRRESRWLDAQLRALFSAVSCAALNFSRKKKRLSATSKTRFNYAPYHHRAPRLRAPTICS